MRFYSFFLVCTLCFLGITHRTSADFLPATDDIPLMDGVTLQENTDFSFDTPAGQILTFDAKTKKTPDEVRSFYAKTLTALGWTWKKHDFYTRGSDTFELSFPQKGSVHFDITLSSTTRSE